MLFISINLGLFKCECASGLIVSLAIHRHDQSFDL